MTRDITWKFNIQRLFRRNKVEICHASLIWINHWLVSYPVLNIELAYWNYCNLDWTDFAGQVEAKCHDCWHELFFQNRRTLIEKKKDKQKWKKKQVYGGKFSDFRFIQFLKCFVGLMRSTGRCALFGCISCKSTVYDNS